MEVQNDITLQFHIFVPITYTLGNWVEQLLGTLIKPIQAEFGDRLRWMWVTRYGEEAQSAFIATTSEEMLGQPIPDNFIFDGMTRRIIFRAGCDDTTINLVHLRLIELAQTNGLHLRTVNYDVVADLGSDRFAHPDSSFVERARRAELVASSVGSTLNLMLDALVEENGQWRLQTWEHEQNPGPNTFFTSIHHLFCNLTNFHVLLEMQVSQHPETKSDFLFLRTRYMRSHVQIKIEHLRDKISQWLVTS